MSYSARTRLLNFFRKALSNPIAEQILLLLVPGRPSSAFLSKLVPMPYLYPAPTWRLAERDGLKLKLDLSDLVDWYVYFGFQDRANDFLFGLVKPNYCIFDVGANIGYVSLRCGLLASKGSVTGFEPSSHNFAKCMANLNLNELSNVNVYNLGMGRKEGVMHLGVDDVHNRGMNNIRAVPESVSGEDEKINVSTIDRWIQHHAVAQIDLIKIDVEGFEMEILKGAEHTISQFKPGLFLEVNDRFLKRFGSSAHELFEWLSDRQYALYDVFGQPVPNFELLLRGQMDIYAKSKA